VEHIALNANNRDLICLSHLRWNFVFQRPQHLMTRFARAYRVFYLEEPVFDADQAELRISIDGEVRICVPGLPPGLSPAQQTAALETLFDDLLTQHNIMHPVLWYYTPMALTFTRHVSAAATVFDCMDELSAFKDAPSALIGLEAELLSRADLVFTGGYSLFEAKRERHPRVYPFPSSVDVHHFARARQLAHEADDQAAIPHPRLGFFGVIDERIDLALIDAVAAARPDWHLVFVGPIAKIDPGSLPRRPNIHFLGMKNYAELPGYLAGWDVALLPFAQNDATRFISPTKTPEYLAAGRQVVSTPVRDVIQPYGAQGLVAIADGHEAFLTAIENALSGEPAGWRQNVDQLLSQMSWDDTWQRMSDLVTSLHALSATDERSSVPTSPRPWPQASLQPNF
jgi:UDP-galactopyranose mutase